MELDLLDPHSVLECLPACKNDSKFTGTKQVYYLFQIKIFSLCLISVMLSKHKQTEQYALAVHKIVNPLPLKTTYVLLILRICFTFIIILHVILSQIFVTSIKHQPRNLSLTFIKGKKSFNKKIHE